MILPFFAVFTTTVLSRIITFLIPYFLFRRQYGWWILIFCCFLKRFEGSGASWHHLKWNRTACVTSHHITQCECVFLSIGLLQGSDFRVQSRAGEKAHAAERGLLSVCSLSQQLYSNSVDLFPVSPIYTHIKELPFFTPATFYPGASPVTAGSRNLSWSSRTSTKKLQNNSNQNICQCNCGNFVILDCFYCIGIFKHSRTKAF